MTGSLPTVLAVGPCFPTADKRRQVETALERDGMTVVWVENQDAAARWLCDHAPSAVLIDLSLRDGSPLAVADFCNYRRPEARVILKGGGNLLTNGWLFGQVGNAVALASDSMAGADLSALIAHHAGALPTRQMEAV